MNSLEPRKLGQYSVQFLCKRLLRILYFSGIERPNARNFKARANDCGETSLRAAEDNVEEVCPRWDRLDGLEGRRGLAHSALLPPGVSMSRRIFFAWGGADLSA
jgi:hypothetical protein